MRPEQALAGIILCAVELLKAGKGEADPAGDAVANPSFSMERFEELRGKKTAPPQPPPEKEILKIIREASAEEGEGLKTLREAAAGEVITLLEKKREQIWDTAGGGRGKPSFLQIEKALTEEGSAPAAGAEGGLHNYSMREISDFFQRDSRRYDSGFERY
jgi:hypothetical protein